MHLLNWSKNLTAEIKESTGVEIFLAYGALLGAVREGKLIGHDFDLDFAFLSPSAQKEEIANTATRVLGFLVRKGFKVDAESNGQFKAYAHQSGVELKVEFFASWVENDKFYLYFAVKDAPIASSILPLGSISVEGVEFAAPHEPQALLAATYGKNWRIPDPGFKYELSSADWKPFSFLFSRENANFWDSYYKELKDNLVWVEIPSQFAIFTAGHLEGQQRVADLGCGNGRDGLYFAQIGHHVSFFDYSSEAIAVCKDRAKNANISNANFSVFNVANIAQTESVAVQNGESFDCLYARFFLHAINEIAERNVLRFAAQVLKPKGRFFIECRTSEAGDPPEDQFFYENGKHYRRMVSIDSLVALAIDFGFTVEYSVVGHGMAKFRREDPRVLRVILVRKD